MTEYRWHDLGNGRQVYRPVRAPQPNNRSHLPAPRIRADGMDAVQNPCDGKFYESRSEYERVVKEAGCEIVGNDSHWDAPPKQYEPEGVKEDLIDAWKRLS